MTRDGDTVAVQATDLTIEGLGFSAAFRLRKGELVRLAEKPNAGTWVHARVVHVCGPDEDGCYRTGAEFVFGTGADSNSQGG